jgi:hypothetical protein
MSLILGGLAIPMTASAQEALSEADRKEAAEWLEQVKNNFYSGDAARIRKAEEALSNAAGSETAAMALYVAAMKSAMLNQTSITSRIVSSSNGRMGGGMMMGGPGGGGRMGGGAMGGNSSSKSTSAQSQFSEWRKQNTGSNLQPGFKKALQIQCKWMLLCLKKTVDEKKGGNMNVTSSILGILNEVAENANSIADQLWQAGSVGNVIRQYLQISDYRPQSIPDNMCDVGGVFERVLLTPYKENSDVEGFRNMWAKRVSIECAIIAASASDKKEAEANVASHKAKRQWEREKACFELGDEVRALANIKKIIVGMTNPSDKQQAMSDLEQLLTKKKDDSSSRRDRNDRWGGPNGGPGGGGPGGPGGPGM